MFFLHVLVFPALNAWCSCDGNSVLPKLKSRHELLAVTQQSKPKNSAYQFPSTGRVSVNQAFGVMFPGIAYVPCDETVG